MSKPLVHAKSSVKHFGGKPTDYLDIHVLIDSSRGAFPDLRHRALTHNSWFITEIIPRIFGERRKNSAGKFYSVRAVAEYHVLEDFHGAFIPSVQDFLAGLKFKDWMDNGNGTPPSAVRLKSWQKKRRAQQESDKKSKAPRRTGTKVVLTRRNVGNFDFDTMRRQPGRCGGAPGDGMMD